MHTQAVRIYTVTNKTLTISALQPAITRQMGGADLPAPVKIWIGKEDHLIRKLHYEIDMDAVAERLPDEMKSSMAAYLRGMKMINTEEHTNVEVDIAVSDADFTFLPPEGAKLVDDFQPPGREQPQRKELIGQAAPDFALTDVDGQAMKLADLRGKVVLIDFWATWCGPCKKAMPEVQILHEIYREQNLVILGINSWERQADQVKPFLEEHKITYKILLDSNNEVIGQYGVIDIPTLFLIDKKGTIRHSFQGAQTSNQTLQQALEALLNESAPDMEEGH